MTEVRALSCSSVRRDEQRARREAPGERRRDSQPLLGRGLYATGPGIVTFRPRAGAQIRGVVSAHDLRIGPATLVPSRAGPHEVFQ